MRFGEWSIDWEVYDWLLDHLPLQKTILELGSGWASGQLSKRWKVHSIEHEFGFLRKYNTDYVYAPIDGYEWYDGNVLEAVLPQISYDLILIDGPESHRRKNIVHRESLFDWSKPVIIDDVQEHYLMAEGVRIAESLCKRSYEVIAGGTGKRFMVIPC